MKRFKDILCVLGPCDTGRPALERAVAHAQNNQAVLRVVVVVPHITAGIGMPVRSQIACNQTTRIPFTDLSGKLTAGELCI